MSNDELKPKPFKFARPWETPPREDETSPPPQAAHVSVPTTVVKQESWTEAGNGEVKVKVEKEEGWSEEVEVFSFDRDKLVLTSEKVRVMKRESTSESTNSPSTCAASADTDSKSSHMDSSIPSSSSWSRSSFSGSNSTSSSDSEEKRRPRRKKPYEAGTKRKNLNKINKDKDEPQASDEDEENDEAAAGSNSDIDVEDDDDDSDIDVTLRLEEVFPEGRNRERRNSKWADYGVTRKSSRLGSAKAKFCSKSHKAQVVKKLTSLLKKDPQSLTEDDKISLTAFPEMADEARKRLEKRQLASERMKEEEDPEDQLEKKCARLSQVISKAKYLVVYTGAGISTSASIPDYRGPNGIWTLLRKGQSIADDLKQFPQSADPTLTHMAIKELYDKGVIKHIVSQNVDGLHLRSGIPKTALSEVHGNMYIEVCVECNREYVRLFDVTEKTKRHHHKTGRYCYHCGSALKDSVVLFGEKGSLRWPINWAGAEYNVDKADVILCLGSSLKVLRRYPWLWSMSKPAKQRPKLYIVNLQWTPKDRFATLKVNGRCDEVIAKVMDNLKISIPDYKREVDPIFTLATLLHSSESSTKRSKDLTLPEGISYPEKSSDLRNYFRFEPVFCKEVRALNQVKRKIVDGEDDNDKDKDGDNSKSTSCGIGWLGNALSVKPKKKKLK